MTAAIQAGAALRNMGPQSPPDVLHVSAVWCAPDGSWPVIRIGPGSPRSRIDGFRLRLARARADAVLTTGANLRAEPALRHTLDGEGAAELGRHRREKLGRPGPPESAF